MDKQMYKVMIAEYMRREAELKQQVLELTMENAELNFFTIGCEIPLYLDNKFGISKPYLVSRCWAVHCRIIISRYRGSHYISPITF